MEKIQLILPGSIRSKKNSKVATIIGGKNKPRRAIILPSAAYKKWEQGVISSLGKETTQRAKIASEIQVAAVAYVKGVLPDLSGMLESVGDCLEKAGIIENDKQIKSWDGSRVYRDKDNPRTIVEIVPFYDGQKQLFEEV